MLVVSDTSAICIATFQERFYFGDAVLPLFESGIPLLLDRLRDLPDRENVSATYLIYQTDPRDPLHHHSIPSCFQPYHSSISAPLPLTITLRMPMNRITHPFPKVIIAYPDEGAHKRFHKTFKAEGYQEVICTKVRLHWTICAPLLHSG